MSPQTVEILRRDSLIPNPNERGAFDLAGPSDGGLLTGTWVDVLEVALSTDVTQIMQVNFASSFSFLKLSPLLRARVMEELRMPPTFFDRTYQESNGFCECDYELGEGNVVQSHVTWFRFLVKQTFKHLYHKPNFSRHASRHDADLTEPAMLGSVYDPRSIHYGWEWYKMSFLCYWNASGHATIVCFDVPTKARASIRSVYSSQVFFDTGPYCKLSSILDELLRLYDDSVWSIRTHICSWETARPQEADYSLLHEIARHGIHVNETLKVAVGTIEALRQQHAQFRALTAQADKSREWDATQNQIIGIHRFFKGIVQRSEAHNSRIQNEITLAFNAAAQRDNRTQVQIGQEAKKEASAMRAIAVVTMTFLPATFVSSVFGMSFFAFEPTKDASSSSFAMSPNFWLYWVVTIPLTIGTLLVWWYWSERIERVSR